MKGAVTASTQDAADAGAEILRAGGNAVDAAVAAMLATAVADPCNVGIGGYGGYMVLHGGFGAHCVQFPLWAPAAIPPESLARPYPEEGPECSSVPNVVGGLARALAGFGKLSWARVSAPAIRLAREGVTANAATRRAFEENRHRPFMGECFAIEPDARHFVFRQPALAATLERMAEHGPQWFYDGPLGEAACRAWASAGVNVPIAEWRNQGDAVEVVPPAQATVAGVGLFGATPDLSGAACAFATFAAASRIGAGALLEPAGQGELASAMARLWQYRFSAAGANDFGGIELDGWIESALAHRGPAMKGAAEAAHTAHVNAADGEGNMAALTSTHGPAWFGGRWAPPGTGVVMNGGMHNFTRPVTVPRRGRRLGVSNMSPTIAVAGSGRRVAVGGPGARRIPSNVGLVLARHFTAGLDIQRAVSAGRFHAEEAHRAFYEAARTSPELLAELRGRFGAVEPHGAEHYFGPLTAISVSPGGEMACAVDDREAVGFAAFA